MTAATSIIDVAALAEVSLGTVSNVLNRPEMVAPATRERVLRAMSELGYVRNEAARQLRTGHSQLIGVVVLDVRNPFFTDLAAGVEESAATAGLSVMLCSSGERRDRESHYLSLLEQQRAYGILLTPVEDKIPGIQAIRRRGTAVVLVDRGSAKGQCSVSVNDQVGGELAITHLLALGHQRLGFIGGPMVIKQVGDRLAGARRALLAGGLPERALTVIETPALTVAAGLRAAAEITRMPPGSRPTAVFCANDMLALGFLQEMTRQRRRVPDEIAIIGYDDIDFAAAAAVPLTSVRQPRVQLGRTATELLIEEVSGPAEHQHRQVVFEPELVVRQSTAPS